MGKKYRWEASAVDAIQEAAGLFLNKEVESKHFRNRNSLIDEISWNIIIKLIANNILLDNLVEIYA